MDKYPLLSPSDFANMCTDLIQIREGIQFECFGEGKDSGIDLRGNLNGQKIIVQIKHISNYNTLKRELKNIELAKVKKLNPDRYILIISMALGPKRKDEILNIFKDYITDNTDFINGADIDNYLRNSKYKSVLNYFKQRVMASINIFSNDEIDDEDPYRNCIWLYENIEHVRKYYVETKCFNKLKESIKKNNIVILSGDAGSGKTTNAKMLIHYILNTHQIGEVIVIKSFNDFFKFYNGQKWEKKIRFNLI